MLRWLYIRVCCGAALLSALAGCVSPGALSDRAIEYNKVAADAADAQLLLNIVRASYRNPTHYSSISQLRDARSNEGSGTFGAQFPLRDGLSAFSFSPSLGFRASQSPSFDVAPLDTKAAALGLFRPVETETFAMYWQQSWSRNLVLALFVDALTMNKAAVDACGIPTDPKGWKDGVYFIDNAAYSSAKFAWALKAFNCLRENLYVDQREADAALDNLKVADLEVFKALPSLTKDGFDIERKGHGAGAVYSIRKSVTRWELTLKFKKMSGRATAAATAGRPVVDKGSVPAVALKMRSIDGMIYFIGEILRQQNAGLGPVMIPSHDIEKDEDVLKPIFRVRRGIGGLSPNSIQVTFMGEVYVVDRDPHPNDLTLTTLSLISQLFAQYRESTDLPKTQAVQVVGVP